MCKRCFIIISSSGNIIIVITPQVMMYIYLLMSRKERKTNFTSTKLQTLQQVCCTTGDLVMCDKQ